MSHGTRLRTRVRSPAPPPHCEYGSRALTGLAPTLTRSSGDVLAMLRKAGGRAPRLRLAKLRGLIALLLSLIGLGSLKRGRRSDCGVVARETRPPIHRHEKGSLRLRTWRIQPRSPCPNRRYCRPTYRSTIGRMPRIKVSLSLDPLLMRDVDAFVEAHGDTDRSKVVDDALQLWAAAQQRSAMELQFADEGDPDPMELDAWHTVRREAARRRLRRT